MGGNSQKDLVLHLRSQFEVHADDRCFTFLNESGRHLVPEVTSFGDLDRDAREVAAWLSSRPEAKRPVLLLFEPGIDFWRAFLGCLYAGVIAVPTPLPIDERSMKRVAGILRDADSSLALTTEKLRGLLTAGIAGFDLERPLSCVATDDAPLADADTWTMPHLTPDTVAFLQYTSGSTGDPKGVAVTHGNVVNNEAAMSEALRAGATSVLVGWIPHWHDMGLLGLLLAFFNGANLVTMSPLAFLKQPVRLLKAISDYRGTITAAPNFAYDLIARRVTPEQLAGLDLSAWEVALNGAEPVRRRTVERFTNVLAPAGFTPSAMRPAYGMAEVTLMATVSRGVPRHLDADADALEQHRYTPATGPRDQSGQLRRTGARRRGADRRPRNLERAARRRRRRDLAAQRERRQRLSQPSRGDGRTVSGPDFRRRGPVSAHRRPRPAPRRRALCHRPPQRPVDRQRPQPVPAGHRRSPSRTCTRPWPAHAGAPCPSTSTTPNAWS